MLVGCSFYIDDWTDDDSESRMLPAHGLISSLLFFSGKVVF